MTVTAVFLDAYNTLIDLRGVHAECVGRILKAMGARVPPEEFHSFWDGRERANAAEAASRRSGRFLDQRALNVLSLEETFAHFGMEGDAEGAVELWIELTRKCGLFPEIRPALDGLREDFKLGLVSNSDNYPLLHVLRREGLEFEAVVTSQTARAYKPDPRIFRFALKAVGCRPGETVHVGDTPAADVSGARAAMLRTVWLNREGRGLESGEPAADGVVRDLSELSAILGRWNAGQSGKKSQSLS